jgi:hypothetical protein
MAAVADVVSRPDSVATAAEPVSARKLRRDNADMESSRCFLWINDAPGVGIPQAARIAAALQAGTGMLSFDRG